MLSELIAKARSYRRFDETAMISRHKLEELIDLARFTPSGGNLQPLRYYLSCDEDTNARIFSCLSWAGYLKDWHGPGNGERPTAYIVILRDNEITTNYIIDHGIAAQTINLAAAERGLGACIIGTIDRPRLRAELELSTRYEILIVMALGEPIEKVVLEDASSEDIRYWRDEQGIHHVPKRPLKEILLN